MTTGFAAGLRASDVAPGTVVTVMVGGRSVCVGHTIDGRWGAIEDVCTHDGGQLTGGVVEGEEIVCPRHGARFCIRTGAALTAPAYEPVAILPVRVENGVIQVRDNRWD